MDFRFAYETVSRGSFVSQPHTSLFLPRHPVAISSLSRKNENCRLLFARVRTCEGKRVREVDCENNFPLSCAARLIRRTGSRWPARIFSVSASAKRSVKRPEKWETASIIPLRSIFQMKLPTIYRGCNTPLGIFAQNATEMRVNVRFLLANLSPFCFFLFFFFFFVLHAERKLLPRLGLMASFLARLSAVLVISSIQFIQPLP